MRWKVFEPVLLLGKQRFSNVDIRIRVKGGGNVSQIYAIRQAISKGIVAFYQKCEWQAETAGWAGAWVVAPCWAVSAAIPAGQALWGSGGRHSTRALA
jgi:hypothetical protein